MMIEFDHVIKKYNDFTLDLNMQVPAFPFSLIF